MAHNLSLSEQLTFSTARIECETPEGVSTGTGFFFRFLDDGAIHVPVFVTNKHVVKNAQRGKFHLTLSTPMSEPQRGQHIALILDDFEKRWLAHPDPNVDLCIMAL